MAERRPQIERFDVEPESVESKTAWLGSGLLHGVLLILMVTGLPSFLERDMVAPPPVMVVEILPVSNVTNVKASPMKQESTPKEEPKKAEEPKPEPKKEEPKPEPKKEEPAPEPEPKKEEPKKEPKKEEPKPEPKKEGPKKEEPKKNKQTEDFQEILKNLANKAQETPNQANDTNPNKAVNTNYDASQPMSVSEIDYIRQHMRTCWSVPSGVADARKLIVTLKIQMLQDGTVSQVTVENAAQMGGDPAWRAAAESAVRAVRLCSPFNRLPPEKYQQWRETTMTFDPSQMLY